jgi:hypothetical protein
MQVATGTVVDGKVVIEGVALPEGSLVAVLASGKSDRFSLAPEEEDELLEALAEIERGEVVELEELLSSLPRRR